MTEGPHLAEGRAAFDRGAWGDADAALERAERARPLEPRDLERWALCAHLLGREAAFSDRMDEAHRRHLAAGDTVRAAYCACWTGLQLAGSGSVAPAAGWFARARRLLEPVEGETAVHGYLAMAEAQRRLGAGEPEEAHALAAEALEIGGRAGDDDLAVLALHTMGIALLRRARVREGLELLDEAMVAVATSDLSPQVPGIVYCSVIAACRAIWSLRRAREWTEELTRWCERQPDLVAYTDECRVDRAEILLLQGAWRDAAAEVDRARDRGPDGPSPRIAAEASYRRGEIHRLVGEFDAAERAYEQASLQGREPQPGLALLRAVQGDVTTAARAIRRLAGETTDPPKRARLLPALVEIALLDGARDEARRAAAELAGIADAYGTRALRTMADHAAGAVALADGRAEAALTALRRALDGWTDLEVPYEAARVRASLGLACRLAGDDEGAGMALAAARATFAALGAAPDLERLEALERAAAGASAHGLTPRQRQVLHALASGATNKAIAAELGISERTVDRHVSDVFDKLGVASRAEATAYAVRHGLA